MKTLLILLILSVTLTNTVRSQETILSALTDLDQLFTDANSLKVPSNCPTLTCPSGYYKARSWANMCSCFKIRSESNTAELKQYPMCDTLKCDSGFHK